MSPAGDAAVTLSAQTGLSYTSGPGRWVLMVTVLGSAVASIDATVVGIALPAIGRDFGAGLTTLQWVVTAYTLALAVDAHVIPQACDHVIPQVLACICFT